MLYCMDLESCGLEYIFTFSEQFHDDNDLHLLMLEIEANDIVDYAWVSMAN